MAARLVLGIGLDREQEADDDPGRRRGRIGRGRRRDLQAADATVVDQHAIRPLEGDRRLLGQNAAERVADRDHGRIGREQRPFGVAVGFQHDGAIDRVGALRPKQRGGPGAGLRGAYSGVEGVRRQAANRLKDGWKFRAAVHGCGATTLALGCALYKMKRQTKKASANMTDGRLTTFRSLRPLLSPYARWSRAISNLAGRYELVGRKPAVVAGRGRPHIYFAGIIVRASYVGFYFMPIYSDRSAFSLSPRLAKLLKGKGCFHIKEADAGLRRELAAVLKRGAALYHARGWL